MTASPEHTNIWSSILEYDTVPSGHPDLSGRPRLAVGFRRSEGAAVLIGVRLESAPYLRRDAETARLFGSG